MRVGIGYDVHRFAAGRRLVLAGVEFAGENGLEGHSDADVLTHAVIDALLGAVGLGDIGDCFPNSAERWRDASSIEMLRTVVAKLEEQNYQVVNVDATVVAERPRIAAERERMVNHLSEVLKVASQFVSIKATTPEGLGALGREEGVAAWAVALVDRIQRPDPA